MAWKVLTVLREEKVPRHERFAKALSFGRMLGYDGKPGYVRMDKSFKLPRQAGKVTFQFDGFNLLNSGVATAFRQTTVNYREVTELLSPRIFRVGFRWDF